MNFDEVLHSVKTMPEPHNSGGRLATLLSHILVSGSLLLSTILLVSGMYQLAACLLRRQLQGISIYLGLKLVYLITGYIGLVSGRLWLNFSLSFLCVAISGILLIKLGWSPRQVNSDQLVLAGTASVSLLLCLFHSATILLLRPARPAPPRSRSLRPTQQPMQMPSRLPHQRQHQPQCTEFQALRHLLSPEGTVAMEALPLPLQPPPPYTAEAKPPDYCESCAYDTYNSILELS